MKPVDFLRCIWPDHGYYVIATPFTIPGTNRTTYAQRVFETIAAAADYAADLAKSKDVFFCIHTLKEPKVWNPRKHNQKTGETGAYEVRVQHNMLASRTFFFDLDVGPEEGKYSDQREAAQSLKEFAATVGLPKPLITTSGTGLHVYWRIASALATDIWKAVAAKLKALALHYGFRIDPARTVDTASVLRVAGTFNRKDPDSPREVRVLSEGVEMPSDDLIARVDAAIEAAGINNVDMGAPPTNILSDLGVESNLTTEYEGPPVKMTALISACAQVQRLARLKGAVSEPEWYHSLNLVRFVENGHKMAHRMSSNHPGYDAEETSAKLFQLEQRNIGPTTCDKLREVCGADGCNGCPFRDQVKSPLVAARYRDKAPVPTIQTLVDEQEVVREIPDAPAPYIRLRAGGIARVEKDEEGIEHYNVIYENDLYPIARLVNVAEQSEQQVWCVHLPRAGATEFTMDADAVYDRRKFSTSAANVGIYVSNHLIAGLQDYMIAYIKELQKLSDAETQCDHLGWNEDLDTFTLPSGAMQLDGSVKPVTISKTARGAADTVKKAGTLEAQIELMKFYNHDAYLVNQFYILAGLMAPMFYATGQYGSILNASGQSGAYKSTTLYTAASLWGHPSLFSLNGTNNGATALGLQQRVATLANLPVCVDEITNMPVHKAQDMAMGVTQPSHRIGLEKSGKERRTITDTHKSTLMLCTANSSLHGLLSTDNTAGTAGSMRVFEIEFTPTNVHEQYEADAFLRAMKQNYGHIGPAFMRYAMLNKERIEQRIHDRMREINERAQTSPAERFWTAIIAVVTVGAEIAKDLGLMTYDKEKLEQWALYEQVPSMRGIVRDEYSNPVTVLTDFIEHNNAKVLVTDNLQRGDKPAPYIVREPRGDMIAHYHKPDGFMNINRGAFKDHCARIGANSTKLINDLSRPSMDSAGTEHRVISNRRTRRVLGAGTEMAKVQSWCFVVNMRHPELAGPMELSVVGGSDADGDSILQGRS